VGPLGSGGALRWEGGLYFPFLSPLAATSPLPGSRKDEPLPDFPGHARKRFRAWNPEGFLTGLPASLAPLPRGSRLDLEARPEESGPVLSWGVSCFPDRVEFSATLENRSDDPCRVHALAPIAATVHFEHGPVSAWRFYKMGSNTTLPSGSLPLAGSERSLGFRLLPEALLPGPLRRMLLLPDETVSVRRGVFSSQWFTLLVHPGSGATVLLGFLGAERHFSTLRLDANRGCLQAAALGDGCELSPGKRFESHRLVALFGRSPHACVERYLESLCAEGGRTRFPSVSLWASWYTGFYDRFRWEDLKDNLEAVSRAPETIEYFQLDDGYQKAVGDWTETGPCLPEGLEVFARTVRRAGLKPGVWLAPFCAGRDSRLRREHPEWLVLNGKGSPVLAGFIAGRLRLRPYHALDLTRSDVQEWLDALFRTLVGWGFELFKLDFLAAGTVPGIRADRGATAAQAYSTGLRVIRRAVGDRPVLGALAPQLCGAGIMDLQRVSPDSSFGGNTWGSSLQRFAGDAVSPCIRNNLRNNFTRSFFGDRLWTNDCDAILYGGLSAAEQRTHLVSNLLLGGVFQVGHDLRKPGYPWEEIARVRSFHPWMRIVPDLFEREFPREALIGATNQEGRNVLLYLLVNPEDVPCALPLRDPSPYLSGKQPLWDQGLEWWVDPPRPARPGDTLSVPARSCRLLEVPLA